MWFFNFFKKKEEVLSNQVVNFDELDKWLERNTEKKVIELNKNINDYLNRIKDKIEEIKLNIFKLENAEINKDIHLDNASQQKLLGNRESYIKDVNLFIKEIVIPNSDVNEVVKFCGNLQVSLDKLAGSTTKNYVIVGQLFGEVSFVAGNLGNLSKLAKELKNICMDEEIKPIYEIKELISIINRKIELRGIVDGRIKEVQDEVIEYENFGNELKKQIEELVNSEKYLNLRVLLEEKEKDEESIKEMERKIKEIFIPLQKSMRKFQKIKDDELLIKYIDDPVNALVGDKEFRIVELMDEMKSSIEQLELNENKEKRVLSELVSLDKAALKYLSESYNELSNAMRKLNEKILRNEVNHKQWILNEKLKSNEERIKVLGNKVIELEAKKQKISFDEIIRIEENLEKIGLKVKVNI